MSKGNNMHGRKNRQGVRINPNELRDNVVASLQDGGVIAALMINGLDGAYVGAGADYQVPLLDGWDWVIIGVQRMGDVEPRIAVIPLADVEIAPTKELHEDHIARKSEPENEVVYE